MRPYLPRDGMSGSPYSEGGALYALGLMYSNYDQANKAFLLQSLRDSSSEVGPTQIELLAEHRATSAVLYMKCAAYVPDMQACRRIDGRTESIYPLQGDLCGFGVCITHLLLTSSEIAACSSNLCNESCHAEQCILRWPMGCASGCELSSAGPVAKIG